MPIIIVIQIVHPTKFSKPRYMTMAQFFLLYVPKEKEVQKLVNNETPFPAKNWWIKRLQEWEYYNQQTTLHWRANYNETNYRIYE